MNSKNRDLKSCLSGSSSHQKARTLFFAYLYYRTYSIINNLKDITKEKTHFYAFSTKRGSMDLPHP